MDPFDEEILNLWKSLDQHKVVYIMVGGFATNLHGFQRHTGDIDLWIKDTIENRRNLRSALNEIEAGDLIDIETKDFLPGWSTIYLASGFEVDLMTSLKGFAQVAFDDSYAKSPTAVIYDIPIKFLHLNQLIEEKKASGRSKDLIDVIELEKIKNEKQAGE